jgi:hypothetical protein
MATLTDRAFRNRGREDTGIPGREFVTLPIAYAGRPDDRLLVIGTTLVAAATVGGQFVGDESIALLGIEFDRHWPNE